MELILIEDVYNLGKAGEVVKVKPGYGRNFLIPQKKAMLASKGSLKSFDQRKKMLTKQIEQRREIFKQQAGKVQGAEITVTRKAGAENRIFGSVGSQDIVQELKAQGIEVEKKYIVLNEPLKALGNFEVKISFASDIEAIVKVNIIREA